MTRIFLWVSLALPLSLMSACAATPQTDAFRATPPESLPRQIELTDTPFHPQREYQCGPAALATVLQTQRINVTPDELTPQVYLPGREGSLQIELVATARRYGLLPYQLNPELRDVLTEVAAGSPVLVMQNLSLDAFPQWHYAVVVGYDLTNQELVLRSGTTQRWLTPFDVFERTWQRAGHWALVVSAPNRIPATANVERYLQTAHTFEEVQQADLARQAYQAATQRWPEQASAWLMLGNLAFAMQDMAASVQALGEATRLAPDDVTGWNNLAYALDAYGCGAQVKTALHCAQAIAPEDPNVQDSLRELLARPLQTDHSGCPQIQCQR